MLLSRSERKKLRRVGRCSLRPYREVIRARIVLTLDEDPCVARAARRLGIAENTVRRWRDRFLDCGRFGALDDMPRSGRPEVYSALTRCEVIAMACGKPGDFDVACRETWTLTALTSRYGELHPQQAMGRSTVYNILHQEKLRPHRVKMWLHSPDPKFREKVTEICELYLKSASQAVVLCVDEKTGMQALGRKYPERMPVPGRDRRMDYEYVRYGTSKLLAAFNPQTGEVFGQLRPTRTAEDLLAFMQDVAKRYPSQEVHIIWDNLNIHHEGKDQRWTAFNQQNSARFHFHYTPIHASWVNQVELFFGILQRRVLRYGVFASLEELNAAVAKFIVHWNRCERHPFNWTFKGYQRTKLAQAA